ncbi:MAG: hypothetical protein ABIT58_01335, partial [Ferruginibacter sp.]
TPGLNFLYVHLNRVALAAGWHSNKFSNPVYDGAVSIYTEKICRKYCNGNGIIKKPQNNNYEKNSAYFKCNPYAGTAN